MRSLAIAASFAASFILANVGGASALPIKPIDPVSGSFAGSSPSGGGTLPAPSSGITHPIYTENGIDYFGFYIPIRNSYTISAYVSSNVNDNVTISSFLLYNSANFLPSDPFSQAVYKENIPGKYISLNPITLAKGLYYLGVGASGTNALPPSGYAGTLTVAVTTVPLPASAPMFGAAVLALGLAGYGLKRKRAAASA